MLDQIQTIIKRHTESIESLSTSADRIKTFSDLITETIKSNKKILICGNGGSAADSQHMAAEFVGRFKKDRQAMPALALSTDTSIITAIGNDFGIEEIFSKQVEALGKEGDILLTISTSGNSVNLERAITTAKNKSIKNLSLLGNNGGRLKDRVDNYILIESSDTARIQEAQILVIHIICELVESALF